MQNSKNDPFELLKKAKKLGFTESDYRKFRILFARGNEPRIYSSLRSSIAFRELRQSLKPYPFEDPPRSMEGDIILGRNPIGISRYSSEYASSHLLGIGATGVGKTIFLVFLLLQYLPIAGGMWIFDFVKRELRGFKRLAEKAGFDVIVCRHEQFRCNLLDPQSSGPPLYANVCAEFITISLALPAVAKHILKLCIIRLYEKFGLFVNQKADPPVLSELIAEIRRFEGNKAAKDAILIRLEALLANKREVFSVRRGFPVRELAKRLIIWEFDGLEMQYQNLFVSYLLSTLFVHRVSNPSKELVIVALDEASRLYSKKTESTNEGPSYISTMTSVVRKMFIALFVWTQTCHNLSNSIIANSGIKILCRVGTAQDYEIFGRAMGLSSEESQWCKTNLGIGQQVIKMGFGWQKPFLNKSPLVQIPEDVSDTEVRQSAQQLLAMVTPPSVQRLLPSNLCNEKLDKNDRIDMSSDEKKLLEQIRANPQLSSATEHYHATGLSSKRATAAKQSLINKNFIKETVVESGRRGGKQLFLEVVSNKSGGRFGKALHNYLRQKARDWYSKQNCITEAEKMFLVEGKQCYVDLVVTWPDGKKEAVEIETEDTARAAENIRKNIKIGFDVISVITPNHKVREAIKNRAKSEMGSENTSCVRFPSMSFYDK